MANKEQLAILKRGAEVWNEWREEHLDAAIDLGYANLVEAHLSKAHLSKVDLNRTYLGKADLSGADLHEANLSYAYLGWANLRRANLDREDLTGARLVEANLSGANLTGATLSGADLTGINTYRWRVENIVCTHILEGNKRIDFDDKDGFEKSQTYMANIAQLVLNAPSSDLTHYTGRLIEWLVNHRHGEAVLLFRGQLALSMDTVRQEFVVLPKNDGTAERILKEVQGIGEKLLPVFDEMREGSAALCRTLGEVEDAVDQGFQELRDEKAHSPILALKDIDVPLLPVKVRPQGVVDELNKRFASMTPALQRIIVAIQSAIQ